jgi:ABC-type amino acid transport substrate-binding protein
LELTGVSSKEQQRLTDEWLRRHAAGDGAVDGTRSALIVASDEYSDPGLRRLRAPASDAQALTAVLQDPEIGGFQVRTLLNEPAYVISEAIEDFFADRRPDDLLLLHLSCHGLKDEDGQLYFAAANTKLRRLGATAVAADFVNRLMNRSRSRRVVLLLDCCYAGAFERGMTARAGTDMGIEEHFGGHGRAVITASSAMEYAFEGNQLADTQEQQPSVFTSALVEGLETGEADRDQDGLVALDELYDYVYDKVRAATPNQTPGKWTFGVQGELVIARRARPVTTPAPLLPELQQAIDHPLAAVRAGAVQELARLLQSGHAGQALAARLTLERLTNDDSRMVSAAATTALSAAQEHARVAEPDIVEETKAAESVPPVLVLSASAVDFGLLPLRGQSPRRTVRVSNAGGGSLRARATTSASWLKLQLVGDELAITVDTTALGDHDDVITVVSDGGSQTIRVQAQIQPQPQPLEVPAASTPADLSEVPEPGRHGLQDEAAVAEPPTTAIPAQPPLLPARQAVATPTTGTSEEAAARAGSPKGARDSTTLASSSRQLRPARRGARTWIVAAACAVVLIAGATILLLATSSNQPPTGGASSRSSSTTLAAGVDRVLAAKVPAAIKSDGTIKIGTDPTYAPGEFLDTDGKTPIGWDIDLFNAIAAKLGLKTQWQSAVFDTIIPRVQSGKYEMGVSSFTINDQRKQQVNMVSYFNAGTQWATKKGNPTGVQPDNACGKKIAVQTNTVQDTDDLSSKRQQACKSAGKPAITIDRYQRQDQATAAVVSGKDDAMLADSPVVAYAVMQTNGQLELLGSIYDSAPYGFVIKKDQTEFAQVVAGAVKDLVSDGTYKTILTKWGVEAGAIDNPAANP